MKKAAIRFTLGLGLALAAAGSAAAQMGNPMAGMANSIASGMSAAISQNVTGNIKMDSLWNPSADQQALSSPAPTLDIRQMIEQSIQNMPQDQRTQIAQQMTQQNLSLLQQGSAAANQIRTRVRDTIMMDRYRNISAMAPNLYRSNIQPQMVSTIIGTIRPWELPNRFKSQMMPKIVAQVSGQIKAPQIGFMQEGIGNAEFPNVPGLPGGGAPGGAVRDVSSGIKNQQMQFMQNEIMKDPSFPNPQQGMPQQQF